MQAKYILAILAIFATLCFATATLTQQDLMSAEEIALLSEQIDLGIFDEAELDIIASALEAQEQFLLTSSETKNTSFMSNVKSFFNNTYVQYTLVGLATAIAVACLVGLTIFAVKKIRASKKDKQADATTEEESGLLQQYDAVV